MLLVRNGRGLLLGRPQRRSLGVLPVEGVARWGAKWTLCALVEIVVCMYMSLGFFETSSFFDGIFL